MMNLVLQVSNILDNKIMLSKFQHFYKLSNSEECSLYTATSRETGKDVLIKRLRNSLKWDEVLSSKHMQHSQRSKWFPKMYEIFTSKGDYFIVYERPTGQPLKHDSPIKQLSLFIFYPLFNDLCLLFKQFQTLVPNLYISPSWLIMHRNSVRIIHFQPFFPSQDPNKHVATFVPEKDNPEQNASNARSEATVNNREDMHLTLGLIAHHLLTGIEQPSPESATVEECMEAVNEIIQNGSKKILKVTKDKKLAKIVEKMFSVNVFQRPDLASIIEFVKNQVKVYATCNEFSSKIEIRIEHINLTPPEKIKPKIRPCCAVVDPKKDTRVTEQSPRLHRSLCKEDGHSARIDVPQSPTHSDGKKMQVIKEKKIEAFFPDINMKSKRHKTTIGLMNTTMSKPLMFKRLERKCTELK